MNAGTKTVTDIDHLISLGYAPSEVRKTLQLTKGDKNAAVSILARGIRKEDESWRKESADDWLNGVSSNVPKHEQNRALQKSPVYIRISKYHRLDYDVEYIMNITLRNGKQWVVGRTYNQFSVFKQNLPLGTCMKFINAFPMPNFFQFFYAEDTTEFLEKRRDMLGEWIREMSLNEECMTSPRVLELLTSFIDLPVHCGPGASLSKPETFSAQQSPTNSDAQKAVASGTESYSSPLLTAFSTNDFEFRKTTILQNIPLIDDQRFPLTLHDMSSALPYKVELKRLQCGREYVAARRAAKEKSLMKAQATADENGSIAASPVIDRDDCCIVVDEKQLGKDLSRDRLVVQGKKVPGSLVSLEEVVDLCKQTMLQVIVKSGHQLSAVKNSGQQSLVTPPPPPGNYNGRPALDRENTATRASASLNVLDQVSKAALQQICRTESAFLSHTSLNEMLDLENRRQLETFMPFLVVPESALADPLVLNFRVQERVVPEKGSSGNLRKVGSNLNVLNSVDVPVAVPVSSSSSSSSSTSNIGSSHAAVVPEPSPTSYCTNNNSFYHTGEPHNNRYQQQSSSSSSLHEWCLVCEGEAATVYRLLDPESMEAVLQLKVTYMHTLFAHPVIESTARAEKVTDFRLREGKTYLVLSRDTTATARDWDKR